MHRNLATLFSKLIGYLPQAPREMEMEVNNISDSNLLTYFVASSMRLDTSDRQSLLEERNTEKRMRKPHDAAHEGARSRRARAQDPVRHPARDGEESARVLPAPATACDSGRTRRDRSAASRDERAAQEARRSGPARGRKKAADRELDRLSKVPQASPEYSVIRTYLDWIVQLPWGKETTDAIDIPKARAILDEDHYDLEKVKDRIVEYLAVGKLKKRLTGPILCFVGPPGVGKTSLGQSIATRHGPQVRAPLRRRRPRRGRDPRSSPHVHRRDAGHDRARAARRGHAQSRS